MRLLSAICAAMQGEVPLLDTGNSLYGSMLARTTKGRGIIEP